MQEVIQKKIEEIRQKPEHIRLLYVWSLMGIMMVIIFGIWIVTITENFRQTTPELKEFTKSFKPTSPTEAPSIESLSKSMQQDESGSSQTSQQREIPTTGFPQNYGN